MNLQWFEQIGLYLLPIVASWIQGNETVIADFLAKEGAYGATDIIAAVKKLNPYLGGILQAAYDAVQGNLPVYAGDGVKWLLALIEAAEQKLKGG